MALKLRIWVLIWVIKNMYGYMKISTKLIYAQAMHETGNLTSNVFKSNNNLFGMRQAKVRKNYATGTANGHATFKNHLDSVRDYFERCQNFRISKESDTAFVDSTVASNYAEDPQYKSKWWKTFDSIKAPVSNNMLYIGLFFLVLILFLIIKKGTRKK